MKISFRKDEEKLERRVEALYRGFREKKMRVLKKLLGKEARLAIRPPHHWEQKIIGIVMDVDMDNVEILVNGKASPEFELFDNKEFSIPLDHVVSIEG